MIKPFFSIITCSLNSQETIQRTIESVKQQTFKNFEHIFIDGFSNDKTLEIINKYKQEYPSFVWLYQFPAKGIGNAFNKGIEKANGEYLYFLNSDDWFYNDKVLENVYEFLEKIKI